jgi:hypothetical protein
MNFVQRANQRPKRQTRVLFWGLWQQKREDGETCEAVTLTRAIRSGSRTEHPFVLILRVVDVSQLSQARHDTVPDSNTVIIAASIQVPMSYTGFWDELRKIPPVTRFLCGSSLAVSIPVMLQLLSPYKVVFVRALVTQKFEVCFHAQREQLRSDEAQLWRIWSSFFFGGISPSRSPTCLEMLKLDCRRRSQLYF